MATTPANRQPAWDEVQESLSMSISVVRAWAVCPEQFDQISREDRANLFLLLLKMLETTHQKLG